MSIRAYAIIFVILWVVSGGVTYSIWRQRATSSLARAVVRFFVALTVQFFLAAVLYSIAVSTVEDFAFMDDFYEAIPPAQLRNITRIGAVYTGLILAVAMIDMATSYARDKTTESTRVSQMNDTFTDDTADMIGQTADDVTDVKERVRSIERKMGT